MEHNTPTAPSVPSQDPPQDQCAITLPSNIALVLHAVRVLLGYGRHLATTVCHLAAAPSFSTIGECFGTGNLSTIGARVNRGILRAMALERVLLAWAAAGKDIEFVPRRTHAPEPQPAPAEADAQQPTVLPTRIRHTSRPSRRVGWNDPEFVMPTLEDLERQVRRRPVGRTILDICLDLAVVPGLCQSAFWNELFDIMNWFGGSVDRLMREKARRRQAFGQEQDRTPGSAWNWLHMKRDAALQVLGFYIGEPPVNPLDPAAAIATAPP